MITKVEKEALLWDYSNGIEWKSGNDNKSGKMITKVENGQLFKDYIPLLNYIQVDTEREVLIRGY